MDKHNKKEEKKSPFAPDEETLHTTDPQDHMEGPLSSPMKDVKENIEDQDKDESSPGMDTNRA